MEGQTNRFSSVGFHVEQGANFKKASEQLLSWIIDSKLTREQVLSISANETTIESGDCELTLYYLKEKEPQFSSLAGLKFHYEKNMKEWDEILEDARRFSQIKCDVIAITHTPKSIGRLNIQILWYLPCNEISVVHLENVENKQGDIERVMKEQMAYLNKKVAPHQIAGFSIFEEMHPCDSREINSTVLFKGELCEGGLPLKEKNIIGDVYHY